MLNFQSMIATKAARVCLAANGDTPCQLLFNACPRRRL
jgi:hypothetical protein